MHAVHLVYRISSEYPKKQHVTPNLITTTAMPICMPLIISCVILNREFKRFVQSIEPKINCHAPSSFHCLVDYEKRLHSLSFSCSIPRRFKVMCFSNWYIALRQLLGETYDARRSREEIICSKSALQDYKSLEPWITRMMEGERHALWPGKTKWFAQSSGTSGGPRKFIPVSKESLENCHFKGGKDMLAIYLSNHSESSLFEGKI